MSTSKKNNVQSIGHSVRMQHDMEASGLDGTDVLNMLTADISYFTLPTPWGNCAIGGGPYRARPQNIAGHYFIKVAAEIVEPFDNEVLIRDFSVPTSKHAVEYAILSGLLAARYNMVPFVGCAGGRGRTGLILGILAKAALGALRPSVLGVQLGRLPDPVEWIRTHYNPHACETAEQESYVRDFDTTGIERILRKF
jgi:hypothetical protein